MKLGMLAVALGLCAAPAFAQIGPSPYAGQDARNIKALSDEDITSLLKGEGIGMAKAAELNGYPGPAHVLALAAQLKLSKVQRRDVQTIFDRMRTRAVALGTEIVKRERTLDQYFLRREATIPDVAAVTAKIASLQGQLRSVHLAAHIETRPLLNPEQLARYRELRGYDVAPARAKHHHDG